MTNAGLKQLLKGGHEKSCDVGEFLYGCPLTRVATPAVSFDCSLKEGIDVGNAVRCVGDRQCHDLAARRGTVALSALLRRTLHLLGGNGWNSR